MIYTAIGIEAIALAQAVVAGTEPWLPFLREIGSFGLVAFIVYWYATHVAPKSEERFLQSLKEAREDYLNSAAKQREDYLKSNEVQRADHTTDRNYDREQMDKIAVAMNKLADSVTTLTNATTTHIIEARAVWQTRGELPANGKT